jgi:hypothetical protein
MGFMFYFRMSPASANRRLWFGQTLHHLERIEKLLEQIAAKIDKKTIDLIMRRPFDSVARRRPSLTEALPVESR